MQPTISAILPEGERAFIKFVGSAENRAPDRQTIEAMLQECDCHRFACYPKNRRPRQLQQGTLLFLGRLVQTGTSVDIRIVGLAKATAYRADLHEATPEQIQVHPWKKEWPHAVPLTEATFVAGQLHNGISLNGMMEQFQEQSFCSTQRNARNARGNRDPRRAYRQQASVEVTPAAARWLLQQLEAAFQQHGKLIVGAVSPKAIDGQREDRQATDGQATDGQPEMAMGKAAGGS